MSPLKKSKAFMNKIWMKTSNLIAGIGAAVLFLMSLFFQGRVHYHVKKEKAAGYGTLESQLRQIGNFDRIHVGKKIKVIFSQDSTTTLRVWAPKELLDSIQTHVVENELQITLSSRIKAKDTIKVVVNNSTLSELELAGGYFETKGILNTEEFHLTMDKDSNCNLNLATQTLKADLAKGSGLNLKGKTENIIFINQ